MKEKSINPPAVYFSAIQAQIIEVLKSAESTIWAAVAWFTDEKIFDCLLAKLDEGVEVKIIIRHDAINFNEYSLDWETFIDEGGQLYTCHGLHHKFVIVDGIHLINGSYNWTYAAAKNQENIIVFKDDKTQQVTTHFIDELETVINESEAVTLPIARFIKPADDYTAAEEEAIDLEYELYDELQEEETAQENRNEKLDEIQIAYNEMDYTTAIKLAQIQLEDNPHHEPFLRFLAWSYLRLYEKDEDLAYLQKLKEVLVTNETHFEDKGNYYTLFSGLVEDTNPAEAITFSKKALATSPDSFVYSSNLMDSLNKNNNQKEASKMGVEILKLATEIIKNPNTDAIDKVFAYRMRIQINQDKPTNLKDAIKAKRIFNQITDPLTKKYWELAQIEDLVIGNLPEYMQAEYHAAE